MNNTQKYSLTAFDPDTAFTPRTVELLRPTASAGRYDLMWVRVIPPLDSGVFATRNPVDIAIIASRHEEMKIENVQGPTHVYLCIVEKDVQLLSPKIDPDKLKIVNWALIEPL